MVRHGKTGPFRRFASHRMRLYSAWRYVIQFGSWPKDEIVVLCRLFDGREPPSAMSIEARKLMKELALELAKSAAKKTVGL